MAVKSIVDIEVNDEAFKKFADTFARYQEELAKTPGVWAEAGAQVKTQGMTFDKLVAAMLAQNELIHRNATDGARVTLETERQVRAWHTLSTQSHKFAHNITSAAKSMFKISALAGAAGGLLGVGSLFGIDKLAGAAGGFRRAALGMGTDIGEQRAFNLDFGRVVDPNSFLSGVNQSLHDVTKRVSLTALGINSGENADTAQVGAEALKRIKTLLDRTPEQQLAQVIQAYQLGNLGIGLQDAERIKHTPAGELGSYNSRFQSDVKLLKLTDSQAKAWQNLQVQLSRAGQSIETTFIVGLTPLAPALEKLSTGFEKVIAAFAGSPAVKHWIEAAATGLQNFATFINTPQFEQDVRDFATWAGEAAHSVKLFAEAVGGAVDRIAGVISGQQPLVEAPKPPSPGDPATQRPAYRNFYNRTEKLKHEGFFGYMRDWFNGTLDKPEPDAAPKKSSFLSFPQPPTATRAMFSAVESRNNLPGGLLNAVYQTESGGGRYLHSAAGADGPFQAMPATARQYGLRDPYDLGQSADFAGRYYHDLLMQFGGDVEKAAAAYNWGPGNLRREIERFGADWKAHLPAEPRNYIGKIDRGIAASGSQTAPPRQQRFSPVQVTVRNQTGGNSIVSAGQMGA